MGEVRNLIVLTNNGRYCLPISQCTECPMINYMGVGELSCRLLNHDSRYMFHEAMFKDCPLGIYYSFVGSKKD